MLLCNLSFGTHGSFCKILPCNLSRYCICSPYYYYTCDLNILGTCIEASDSFSQNRGVTTASPLNPAIVPIVTYEYLVCLPQREWLWPPARRKARDLLSGPCTLGIMGRWWWPKRSGYNWFPLAANDWGTMHPVPDMVPPFLVEQDGPPT
jgi:hypothetical protein